ncbi:hypothetical protein CMUS01_14394 [Colletotrichum musicola]|uniref:Secreted protein n=1 Tax=Colletotrichum musicola TaxID=2175873 RepID=A0A8H6MRD2_9PEZI|nr:hypothetical protein CMUS01_14394 [Colletotrichum musicola]
MLHALLVGVVACVVQSPEGRALEPLIHLLSVLQPVGRVSSREPGKLVRAEHDGGVRRLLVVSQVLPRLLAQAVNARVAVVDEGDPEHVVGGLALGDEDVLGAEAAWLKAGFELDDEPVEEVPEKRSVTVNAIKSTSNPNLLI